MIAKQPKSKNKSKSTNQENMTKQAENASETLGEVGNRRQTDMGKYTN